MDNVTYISGIFGVLCIILLGDLLCFAKHKENGRFAWLKINLYFLYDAGTT
jgi:hypothetical protein